MQLNDMYLKQVCYPYSMGENIIVLSNSMFKLLWRGDKQIGVGLAANQVGIRKRLIVIDYAGFKQAMINPLISKMRGGFSIELESCLSFPNQFVRVKRAKIITVQWFTLGWESKSQKMRGHLARIIQHENDHLNGITMLDIMEKY